MEIATNLSDILKILNRSTTYNDRDYDNDIDTSHARDQDTVKRIKYFLSANSNIPQKILLSGQRGTGKSFIFRQLSKSLESDFYTVRLFVSREIDISNLCYIDLIIMIFSKLMEELKNQKKRIDPSVLDVLYRNLNDEKLIQLLKFNKSEAGNETGTKAGYIKAISNSIKGALATGMEIKEKVRTYLEPKLSQLIKGTNSLIYSMQNILKSQNKNLLFIIDDLDKMEKDYALNLFNNHSNILKSFNMHMIYTYPIELKFNETFNKVNKTFSMFETLCMIKIRNKDASANDKGFKTLEQIIFKRIDNRLFAPNTINFFIEKSGGSLIDLFEMIMEAALNTLCQDDFSNIISIKAAKHAYYKIKNDYEIKLSDLPHEIITKYYQTIKNKAPIDEIFLKLFKQNLIIEYIEDGSWYEFHPSLIDILGL